MSFHKQALHKTILQSPTLFQSHARKWNKDFSSSLSSLKQYVLLYATEIPTKKACTRSDVLTGNSRNFSGKMVAIKPLYIYPLVQWPIPEPLSNLWNQINNAKRAHVQFSVSYLQPW